MNSRPQIRVIAFTLIELLTVITIIAILMGLLFPAIQIVKEQARKAEAKVAVGQIAGAIKQYYTEYGKYPVLDYTKDDATPLDVKVGDSAVGGVLDHNADLFNVLRAKAQGKNSTNDYNPRRISFFEYKSASDTTAPKSGFLDAQTGQNIGALFDPWGKEYCIVLDSNYNEIIKLEGIYSDFKDKTQQDAATQDIGVRSGVGVFSVGKDGVVGAKDGSVPAGQFRQGSRISDDILSWQ